MFRTFPRPFSSSEGVHPPKVNSSDLSKTTTVTDSIKFHLYLGSLLRHQVISYFKHGPRFLSPRAVTKNSRHHSHNQEHNSGCYDRSQCVDRTAIESCMTRTINSNPVYTRYREGTSKGIIFLGEISKEENKLSL